MKILIITDVLLRNDNGVGNSYSNIFENMKNVEIANICCQEGISENHISTQCFQISESRLLLNLKNSAIPTGIREKINNPDREESVSVKNNGFIQMLKRSRLQILFWIRNIIWKVGRWKSQELKRFINDFSPDLIFAQLQDKIYLNNLIKFVHEYTDKPLILYAWDDVYSLKQFSLSPLFWIDRLLQRISIRGLIKKCNLLYTISVEQMEEYSRSLKVKTDLLYKGKSFETIPPIVNCTNKVIRIVYTGNLYSGRYQTLLKICNKLSEYNQSFTKAHLYIYSGTDLTPKEKQALSIPNCCFFMGKVSEAEVKKIQDQADILLHIEPMSLKGSLLCRLSFSTKLVDYFYQAKCIFAVGSVRCSSMKYLKKNDAAIVAFTVEEAEKALEEILETPTVIEEYAVKAWKCGYRNHQIDSIQSKLIHTFNSLINKNDGT